MMEADTRRDLFDVVLVPLHCPRQLSVGEAGALEAVAHDPADLLVGVPAEVELGETQYRRTGKFSGSSAPALFLEVPRFGANAQDVPLGCTRCRQRRPRVGGRS